MFWILIIDIDLFDSFWYLKDTIMQNSKTQEVVWEFSSALSSIASFSQIRKIKMEYEVLTCEEYETLLFVYVVWWISCVMVGHQYRFALEVNSWLDWWNWSSFMCLWFHHQSNIASKKIGLIPFVRDTKFCHCHYYLLINNKTFISYIKCLITLFGDGTQKEERSFCWLVLLII